jgi:hypothetical protein
MQLVPKSKEQWLRTILLPLKAFTLLAPLAYFLLRFCQDRLGEPATDLPGALVICVAPCSLILFFAALYFAFSGPRGTCASCLWFATVGLLFVCVFFPSFVLA